MKTSRIVLSVLFLCSSLWAKQPHILLIGAPGSGKGAITQHLMDRSGYRHICNGDLLRDEMRRETPLGRQIFQSVTRGELIANEIMFKIFEQRFYEYLEQDQSVIVDGMVQSAEHVAYFDNLVQSLGIEQEFVYVYLSVPQSVVEERLLRRVVCTRCGITSSLVDGRFTPCAMCGDLMQKREDDEVATIKRRLERFYSKVVHLVPLYHDRPGFICIDAAGSLQDLMEACDLALPIEGR